VSGLEVLTMLGAIDGPTRVWYAADEWFWHHVSQVRIGDHRTWSELNPALTKLLYERAYRNRVDRVWVVSEPDARAMRWLAGMRNVDILPNGVDATYYRASADPGLPQSAAFWGRLDFGPNLQALEWFCGQVWPRVRERRPGATFTIIGFNPTAAAQALARLPGVSLQPNVPDIRTEVPHHAIVVLPFQSGGGIKNKLLEAAAMSRPTVCSPRAQLGLRGTPPVRVAASVTGWVQALERFWDDQALRERAGRELREWVSAHHSWESVARQAAEILDVRQRSHVAT
jgi:glycosyltransferase involved in cell wall biosynthesis